MQCSKTFLSVELKQIALNVYNKLMERIQQKGAALKETVRLIKVPRTILQRIIAQGPNRKERCDASAFRTIGEHDIDVIRKVIYKFFGEKPVPTLVDETEVNCSF